MYCFGDTGDVLNIQKESLSARTEGETILVQRAVKIIEISPILKKAVKYLSLSEYIISVQLSGREDMLKR